MAAAVSALGSGWSAQIVGDSTNYGSWPSADLYWPAAFPTFEGGTGGQGALQCVAGSFAELKMHTFVLVRHHRDQCLGPDQYYGLAFEAGVFRCQKWRAG
jgi:hypothetical protein